jgi:hypothetical protein
MYFALLHILVVQKPKEVIFLNEFLFCAACICPDALSEVLKATQF